MPAVASFKISAIVFVVLLILKKIFVSSQSSKLVIFAISLSSIAFQSGCTVKVPMTPQVGDLGKLSKR